MTQDETVYGSDQTSDSVLILENTLALGVGGGALAFTLVEVQAAGRGQSSHGNICYIFS